jgi:multidrug resistance efflux pump
MNDQCRMSALTERGALDLAIATLQNRVKDRDAEIERNNAAMAWAEAEIERLRAALAVARQDILGHYLDDCGDHCENAVAKIDAALNEAPRDRCIRRGYHVASADGVAKFRYDQSGVCLDCGVVEKSNG